MYRALFKYSAEYNRVQNFEEISVLWSVLGLCHPMQTFLQIYIGWTLLCYVCYTFTRSNSHFPWLNKISSRDFNLAKRDCLTGWRLIFQNGCFEKLFDWVNMLFLPVAQLNKTLLKINWAALLNCVLKTISINLFEIYFNRDKIFK